MGTTLVALGWRSVVQARYVLLGSLCLLCGFQIVIVGQAAEIERANSFSRIAELMPGFLQRGLGNQAMLLATFKGTVAFGFFHPVVAILTSVVAIYLTTEPAHEVEAGLVDLTLARPVPRHAIVTRSLVLAVVTVLAATMLMALGSAARPLLFCLAGVSTRLRRALSPRSFCTSALSPSVSRRSAWL